MNVEREARKELVRRRISIPYIAVGTKEKRRRDDYYMISVHPLDTVMESIASIKGLETHFDASKVKSMRMMEKWGGLSFFYVSKDLLWAHVSEEWVVQMEINYSDLLEVEDYEEDGVDDSEDEMDNISLSDPPKHL